MDDRSSAPSVQTGVIKASSMLNKMFSFGGRREAPADGETSPKSVLKMSSVEEERYILRQELNEARKALNKLEAKSEAAQSYREKGDELHRQAVRALGRLEQASTKSGCTDLILTTSELKACILQGITLIKVYGHQNAFMKVATLVIRKQVYKKFDEVIDKLDALAQHCCNFAPMLPAHLEVSPSAPSLTLKPSTTGIPNQPGMDRQMVHPSLEAILQARNSNLSRASPSLSAVSKLKDRGPEGKVIREAKHDKVYTMAHKPKNPNTLGSVWWSAGNQYECWTTNDDITSFTFDKDSQIITAMMFDEGGAFWTGHLKGLLRVRGEDSWDSAEDRAFSSAVKVIAYDKQFGQAWIGDADGKVKIFRYHARSGGSSTRTSASGVNPDMSERESVSHARLEMVHALQHGMLSKLVDSAKTVWNVFGNKCEANKGGKDSPGQAVKECLTHGPIRAILCREGRTWISGGHASTAWLALFDSATFEDIDAVSCKGVGTINAMATIPWPTQAVSVCPPPPQPPPRQPTGEKDLATTSTRLAPVTWRLLTGHDNGQLMLWHPRNDKLAPLIKIGEPQSPIRGIHVCEDISLVVTGHQNGELHMFVQSRFALAPGTDSAHPESLGTVKPKQLILKGQKSNLVHMASSGCCFTTASLQGTIRLWFNDHLKEYVERMGLANSMSNQASVASSGAMGHSSSLHLRHSSLNSADVFTHSSSNISSGGGVGNASSFQHAGSLTTGTDRAQSRSDGDNGMIDAALRQAGLQGNAPSHTPTSGSSTGTDRQQARRRSSTGVIGNIEEHMAAHGNAFGGSIQIIDQCELMLLRSIGQGAYGKVWEADWVGTKVAVKELLGFGSEDDAKLWQEMQNEVHMLGSYNHPNIMRFLAITLSPPMIVMQYYPHGSLCDLLSKARNNKASKLAQRELAWIKRLDMLRDVAAGMHYLHTRKPPVVHGDLRSPNLLLDMTIDRERPRFHVKIADFGLARLLNTTGNMIMVSKTTNPRWTAPEVIKNSQIGPAADVYSFAIIMWELLTWQQPYEDMMSVQVILRTVQDQDRPIIPSDTALPGNPGATLQDYKDLMQRCWSADSSLRPTFKQIVDMFQSMREQEAKTAKSQSGAATPTHASRAVTSTAIALLDAPMGTAATAAAIGTPASNNSASSVKSDTAAMILASAANRAANYGTPTASSSQVGTQGQELATRSSATGSLSTRGSAGPSVFATSQQGAEARTVVTAMTAQEQQQQQQQQQLLNASGANIGASVSASGAALQGSSQRFKMSPIAEERSLSIDATSMSVLANLSQHGHHHHQPSHLGPGNPANKPAGNASTPAPVPGGGLGYLSAFSAFSQQAMQPVPSPGPSPQHAPPVMEHQATISDRLSSGADPEQYTSSYSTAAPPVLSQDGDCEADPLEAYRSGVLEDEYAYGHNRATANMPLPSFLTPGLNHAGSGMSEGEPAVFRQSGGSHMSQQNSPRMHMYNGTAPVPIRPASQIPTFQPSYSPKEGTSPAASVASVTSTRSAAGTTAGLRGSYNSTTGMYAAGRGSGAGGGSSQRTSSPSVPRYQVGFTPSERSVTPSNTTRSMQTTGSDGGTRTSSGPRISPTSAVYEPQERHSSPLRKLPSDRSHGLSPRVQGMAGNNIRHRASRSHDQIDLPLHELDLDGGPSDHHHGDTPYYAPPQLQVPSNQLHVRGTLSPTYTGSAGGHNAPSRLGMQALQHGPSNPGSTRHLTTRNSDNNPATVSRKSSGPELQDPRINVRQTTSMSGHVQQLHVSSQVRASGSTASPANQRTMSGGANRMPPRGTSLKGRGSAANTPVSSRHNSPQRSSAVRTSAGNVAMQTSEMQVAHAGAGVHAGNNNGSVKHVRSKSLVQGNSPTARSRPSPSQPERVSLSGHSFNTSASSFQRSSISQSPGHSNRLPANTLQHRSTTGSAGRSGYAGHTSPAGSSQSGHQLPADGLGRLGSPPYIPLGKLGSSELMHRLSARSTSDSPSLEHRSSNPDQGGSSHGASPRSVDEPGHSQNRTFQASARSDQIHHGGPGSAALQQSRPRSSQIPGLNSHLSKTNPSHGNTAPPARVSESAADTSTSAHTARQTSSPAAAPAPGVTGRVSSHNSPFTAHSQAWTENTGARGMPSHGQHGSGRAAGMSAYSPFFSTQSDTTNNVSTDMYQHEQTLSQQPPRPAAKPTGLNAHSPFFSSQDHGAKHAPHVTAVSSTGNAAHGASGKAAGMSAYSPFFNAAEPHDSQPTGIQVGTSSQHQASSAGQASSMNAFSPFFSTQHHENDVASTRSTASAVADTSSTVTGGGLSSYSPFSAVQSASTTHQNDAQPPAVQARQGGMNAFSPFFAMQGQEEGHTSSLPSDPAQGQEPKPQQHTFASMNKYSPFAAASEPERDASICTVTTAEMTAVSNATGFTLSPTTQQEVLSMQTVSKTWSPMSAFSPFASGATCEVPSEVLAQHAQQQQQQGSGLVQGGEHGRAWAPMTAFSPFSGMAQGSEHQSHEHREPRDGDNQATNSLTAYSPFASSSVQGQDSGRQYAVHVAQAESGMGAECGNKPGDASASHKKTFVMSAYSPFSAAADASWN